LTLHNTPASFAQRFLSSPSSGVRDLTPHGPSRAFSRRPRVRRPLLHPHRCLGSTTPDIAARSYPGRTCRDSSPAVPAQNDPPARAGASNGLFRPVACTAKCRNSGAVFPATRRTRPASVQLFDLIGCQRLGVACAACDRRHKSRTGHCKAPTRPRGQCEGSRSR